MFKGTHTVSYFAATNARGTHRVFGIRQEDRFNHMYVIGMTGVGKSTLLASLIKQDMEQGRGLALLDPHGELAAQVMRYIPEHRKANLVFFNVPDNREGIGFNPLEYVPAARRSLAAAGLMDAFKKLWGDSWGPRLEHLLRNATFALLERQDATLSDILRLFDDKAYRTAVAKASTNPEVQRFWLNATRNGYGPRQ
ncbi:MAG: hypothetical protein AMXMBFR84_42380 [Candidatus Hydrogenedentota bacterium]